THSPDCTRRLRRTMELAIAAGADFIDMPEWNEDNENTCVQPTVASGTAHQRIMAYYMHRLRHEPPVPNPGQDLAGPNLLLTYRRILKLGGPLVFEILNVPDSDARKPYTVRLWLRDHRGKPLRDFPLATFVPAELKESRFSIATEDLADCP